MASLVNRRTRGESTNDPKCRSKQSSKENLSQRQRVHLGNFPGSTVWCWNIPMHIRWINSRKHQSQTRKSNPIIKPIDCYWWVRKYCVYKLYMSNVHCSTFVIRCMSYAYSSLWIIYNTAGMLYLLLLSFLLLFPNLKHSLINLIFYLFAWVNVRVVPGLSIGSIPLCSYSPFLLYMPYILS